MQEQLEVNPGDTNGAAGQQRAEQVSRRDVQRVALRDLVALASDCAKTEAEIEQRHQAAIAKGEKEYQTATWALDERVKKLQETVAQEYQARLQQIDEKYQSDLSALKQSDRVARQRVGEEHKVAARELKKDFDQACWLAESLFDGTQAQIREDSKKAKEDHEQQIQWLDSVIAQGANQVRRYRMEPAFMAPPAPADPADLTDFPTCKAALEQQVARLSSLGIPQFFVGAKPHMYLLLIGVAPLAVYMAIQWARGTMTDLQPVPIAIAAGAGVIVATALGITLWVMAKSRVRQAYAEFGQAANQTQAAAQRQLETTLKELEKRLNEAAEKRQAEEQAAKDKFNPMLLEASRRRDASLHAVHAQYADQLPKIEGARDTAKKEAEERQQRALADLRQKRDRDLESLQQRYQFYQDECRRKYEESRQALERRLKEGLEHINAPIGEQGEETKLFPDWTDPSWNNWTPPRQFPPMVRFGDLQVDLNKIADSVPQAGQRQLALPPAFAMPVALAFPRQASLLIQTGREGRLDAVRVLQMVMTRMLTALPAGRVRFTILDPVGLGQNFAGFMHLADHDEALVGGRIWTDNEHIEQRLTDLTEHMETVIQKYLRNEFETIDDYNAQAGELAEPYRFLVIADFPVGFESEALRRLASIASTGSRCGVYTLVFRDTRQPLPSGSHFDELEAHSVNLTWEDGRFVWKDEVFGQFPLTLDAPPTDEFLTRVLDVVGRHAKEAKRVEVPFEAIAPRPDQFWSRDSSSDIGVPIGRLGATRLQSLRLGRGVAQHALIAGKTGSGKSTLLHVLVTNLAMWYSPDEVELYLVDFKKGVEFKTYATHSLPHARAIAVESDREFGLSVLQRIDAELTRRGELFRKIGVQDLASYRQASGQKLPRTLLMIDEFQEFFSEDDKLAQDSALLLDRLVRQGRAFGVHVLLGSQTIGGTSGLGRSTIGQMAVRVALQCSDADSQMILGDANSAARLLSRPGEAIYNDAGGLVEANSPFQISWLPDAHRDRYLAEVTRRAEGRPNGHEPPIVFEGNAPADILRNRQLAQLLEAPDWPEPSAAPVAWLGDPVAIKEATAVVFRRQSGTNLLIVGQQEETAMSVLLSAMISLGVRHRPNAAQFYILDGSPAGSPQSTFFPRMQSVLPHPVHLVEWRAVPDAFNELATEMQRRQETEHADAPEIYIIIYGLQRYRILRRQEDSFSFSGGDEEKKPQPDKQFADLLREGPALGIHLLAWTDTPASVDRTLDRNGLREFDNRVLFQMSASDSSNLIDSPAANKLGFYRALAYSEEQGVMEKFRPYALPDAPWLEQVKAKLHGRGGAPQG